MKLGNYLVSLLEGRYTSGAAKLGDADLNNQLNLLNIPHFASVL